MSAEATSATGGLLAAQDFAKELLAKDERIRELERELDEADARIQALTNELARR